MSLVDGIRDGWEFADKVHQYTGEYGDRGPELTQALLSEGYSREKWKKLHGQGGFRNLYDVGYCISGIGYFLINGTISQVTESEEFPSSDLTSLL